MISLWANPLKIPNRRPLVALNVTHLTLTVLSVRRMIYPFVRISNTDKHIRRSYKLRKTTAK